MYDIYDVADYYLNIRPMTPKKLQKIVYYAYAWFLTLMNEDVNDLSNRLFDDRPQAWVHGPVFKNLYDKYKSFGYQEIDKFDEPKEFSDDVKSILDEVLEVYGDYNANELESITHQESPWQNARKNCSAYEPCINEISDSDIFECYSSRLV